MALFTHTCQLAALILRVFERSSTEFTIFILLVVSLDVKVDRTVRLVGKTIVQYLLHQLLLFDDVTSGMRFDARRQHVEGFHSLMVAVGIVLGYLHRLQLLQTSLLFYLVVAFIGIVLQVAHIGNVAHIANLIT